jgi:hypothetical protein
MVSAPQDLEPLPRCCDSHDDWRTLAEHLVKDFQALPAGDVVRELSRAKTAAEGFGLTTAEMFDVAELMARHQLMLLGGDLPDIARLDPERHTRRSTST